MPEFVQILQSSDSQLVLFFLFFFGTFVSEDAACLAAGAAAANGQASFAFALSACFLGIFAGDLFLYAAGRSFGERIFENRLARRFISRETKQKASDWLEKNGAAAVFLSRFVTGLRLPTYLAAGALKTDFAKFTIYFLLASAIWTPILVGAAAFSQAAFFRQNAILGLIAAFILVRLILKYSSWENRRRFVGRIKRIANWEFWPIQFFYAPVVFYVLWLALKHRSLTAFTAVNPAIRAGGFKGESKNDIYNGLKQSLLAGEFLPVHKLISNEHAIGDRLLAAWQFIDANSLKFPVVLKPDAGERGKDVQIIRSLDDLNDAIYAARTNLILQEFVEGEEVSIFYYRRPSEPSGRIFSITEKRFPSLTGNGRLSIKDLILNDARAVCLAEKYFEQNREHLDIIPAAGESVRLIDIGTHSRGAVFLDGDWLKTDMLESKIDEICRSFDGFYFGRFDIRATSLPDLRQGQNFKIIELNGVTSESTNIYDPRYSLFDAYRILFEQWSLAFEIGAANVKLGARTTSMIGLMRLAMGQSKSRGSHEKLYPAPNLL